MSQQIYSQVVFICDVDIIISAVLFYLFFFFHYLAVNLIFSRCFDDNLKGESLLHYQKKKKIIAIFTASNF